MVYHANLIINTMIIAIKKIFHYLIQRKKKFKQKYIRY